MWDKQAESDNCLGVLVYKYTNLTITAVNFIIYLNSPFLLVDVATGSLNFNVVHEGYVT